MANTGEPLRLVIRPGNRPAQKGAWAAADDAIELRRRAGYCKFRLRGDTDFTRTAYLDRWADEGVAFTFGGDAMSNFQ